MHTDEAQQRPLAANGAAAMDERVDDSTNSGTECGIRDAGARETLYPVGRGDTMDDLERSLGSLRLAPYIIKAMALIGVNRRSGSNMFRHQISTFGILLDYKIIDPVLLKASLIHDLFEDAHSMPGVTQQEISGLDADGPAVYELVMEVTIRMIAGAREPKRDYLLRLMGEGTSRAKTLKLADRISNLFALGFVHDVEFVRRYLEETEACILPYAKEINPNMFRELSDLVASRRRVLPIV
jgi:(p)ppGpp synthase/HD superfamily hydrolase